MVWTIVGIICFIFGCIVLFSDKDNSDIPGLVIIFISSMIACTGIVSMINKNKSPIPNEKNDYIEKVVTLDNNKDTIIVKVKREGNAEITVKLYDKDIVLKVQVTPDKTIFTNGDDFVFFPLDTPDEPVEILPPPDIRGGDK